MLNKRKLKYNFGTECILLKTIYNREYICVKTKGEIYIWLNSVLFTTFCCNDRMIKAFFILRYSFSSISSIFIHFQKILHSYTMSNTKNNDCDLVQNEDNEYLDGGVIHDDDDDVYNCDDVCCNSMQ